MDNKPWGMELKTYLIVMHLSQLIGYLFPIVGLVVPLTMWLTNRSQYREIEIQGTNIANWLLTFFLFFALIFVVLWAFILLAVKADLLIVIGFLLYISAILISVIVPIVGAYNVNKNAEWTYPLTIKFLNKLKTETKESDG